MGHVKHSPQSLPQHGMRTRSGRPSSRGSLSLRNSCLQSGGAGVTEHSVLRRWCSASDHLNRATLGAMATFGLDPLTSLTIQHCGHQTGTLEPNVCCDVVAVVKAAALRRPKILKCCSLGGSRNSERSGWAGWQMPADIKKFEIFDK